MKRSSSIQKTRASTAMNLGRTYTFHFRRKSNGCLKWMGFLVNVWFCSALTLTLNSAGPEFESPAANESLFTAGLRRLWAERVRLLCYNFAGTICHYVFESVKSESENRRQTLE